MSISILSYTQKQYAEAIFSLLGKGQQHAMQLYREWFLKGEVSPLAGWVEPQARELVQKIISATDFSTYPVSQQLQEGEIAKFLLKYDDLLESESVMIPMQFGTTLCISSQVGCRMGCAFCQTGKMGLLRHLSAKEIVAQVFVAKHHFKKEIRNIVFMGMGEPLDNFDELMQAIKILTCPNGLNFGPSRITISTSGLVDKIYKLIDHVDPAINLAVSVNAPTDEIRNKIMPVNRSFDIAALKEAMLAYCAHPRREILAEYVLLQGVNDSLEHADKLCHYLQGLKVKVNLIPYNPQVRDRFSPPDEDVKEAFLARVRLHGYQALLRGTKGQKIMAACGQLGNKAQRQRLLNILS